VIRLVCLLLLLAGTAAAQGISAPVPDPRLQTLQYDAGQVFRLRVPLGFQTTLVLDPNEQVENIALGDSSAWQVTPNQRGDHVFIKPLRVDGITNLTIVTDTRVYVFELSGTSGGTPDAPFVVRFHYPPSPVSGTAETQPADEISRYRLSGTVSLRPQAVTDDGMRTYVEWRPGQPIPAVFALDERRREILVDGHMRDGRYVIDAIHQALLFRLDRQVARATRQPGDGR
jgi:type IV secretion system protein VirB9